MTTPQLKAGLLYGAADHIQSIAINAVAPTNGQALVYNGTTWGPATVTATGAAGGDLSGTYPNPTVAKINGSAVPAGGALTTGNVLQVTGVATLSYAAVNLAGGANFVTGVLPAANQAAQTMAGDVTGTTGASTVSKIQGVVISGVPAIGNTLVATSPTAASWSAPASGVTWAADLLGSTNASQTVVSLSTANATLPIATTNLTFGAAPATTGKLRFSSAITIMAARNAAGSNDIPILVSDASNNFVLFDTTQSNNVTLNAGGTATVHAAGSTVTLQNNTTTVVFGPGAVTFFNGGSSAIAIGTTPAASGAGIRMANGNLISYRNNANTTDLTAMILSGATDTLNIGNANTVLVLTGSAAASAGVQIVSNGGTSTVTTTIGGTLQITSTFTLNTYNNPIATGTNAAASGQLRIPNASFLVARNAANSADLQMWGVDAANNLSTGIGPILWQVGITPSLTQTAANANVVGATMTMRAQAGFAGASQASGGGTLALFGGTGATAASGTIGGGAGGPTTLTAGAGGAGLGVNQTGGAGATATVAGGAGGAATGTAANSNGGNVVLNSGAAGAGGTGAAGAKGFIIFQQGAVEVARWSLNTLNFTGVATGTQAVSAASNGRIFYDSTLQHFFISENGGAYTQLGTGGITQLTGDVTAGPGSGSQAATVVRVNGATVPAAGALTTGNVLQVTGVSTLSYAAVNLAGGANFVTGVLPAANQAAQTMAGDVTGTTAASTVARVNGATVPAAGALTTGNVLQVTGVSTLSYAALNLAGGANFVTGVLPAANQAAQTMAGDVTGTTAASTVAKIQGTAVSAIAPTANQVLAFVGGSWTPTTPNAGAINFNATNVAANYNITATDCILFVRTASGAFTLNLPSPTAGRVIFIVDFDGNSNTNNITLNPNGKINGNNAFTTLATNFAIWKVFSNGTDWAVSQ